MRVTALKACPRNQPPRSNSERMRSQYSYNTRHPFMHATSSHSSAQVSLKIRRQQVHLLAWIQVLKGDQDEKNVTNRKFHLIRTEASTLFSPRVRRCFHFSRHRKFAEAVETSPWHQSLSHVIERPEDDKNRRMQFQPASLVSKSSQTRNLLSQEKLTSFSPFLCQIGSWWVQLLLRATNNQGSLNCAVPAETTN